MADGRISLSRYRVIVEAMAPLSAGALAPCRPYLVLGRWTRVGGGATFGLGWYRLGGPAEAS